MKSYKHYLALLTSMLFILGLHAQTNVGVASYYSPGLHGKRTASGEKYNHKALTCANKDYPIGTQLKVTRVDDGRSVVVRVNDCGPHHGGRIIDLSGAAAIAIGLIDDGITQVRLEVVSMGKGKYACGKAPEKKEAPQPASYDQMPADKTKAATEEAAPQPKVYKPIEAQGTYRADALRPIESGFGVQVGSFRSYDNASKVAASMQDKGYSKVLIRMQGNVHQVVLGPFETREQANVYKDNLRKNYKVRGFVTPIE